MTDRVGQQLGNYRLLRLLGRGGFADVYLGEHTYLNKPAALKVLHMRLDEQDAEQFLREAQTLAGLDHPHIVRVLDFAIQDGMPFLVMDYATGGTLRTRHPAGTRVPLERILAYVSQVASALQYAHHQRLIHRDIKPENMLLGAREQVLLSDFGLAMLMPSSLSMSTQAMGQSMAGTTPYLAPEQLQGQPQLASDQYALGVVVYEWLCGQRPFRGTPIEVALQHISAPPPSLPEQLPDLSPAVAEAVMRALAKGPELRFPSVQDFALALAEASKEEASGQTLPVLASGYSAEARRGVASMQHLPRGTVTLLFAGMEGSSSLLQQVGERYTQVLGECRRLLRAAFHQHHGHEVDTQGDAFFVAFTRATDAISAAVDAQRALASHPWPEGAAVRLRMGLHTGEPSLTSEGYVGLDVHRAARIMGAGHGGQVLLSQTTRDLVEHDLPEGVSLRDLGAHRLKDLQHPSHLFQVVIAGLPIDFPPLRTLDTQPNNLPIQPTPFIGREKEVAAVTALLRREDVRLLTLTGPGGTGKTRLGLQVAAELSEVFADGVFFVNLAPISDPSLVVPTIAQTLDVREAAGQPLLDLVSAFLREKQVLLLLDNFEQVVSAVLEVADLLMVCPRLKVMVTSREVLHVRAEREFAVPVLRVPDPKHLPDLVTLSQYEAVALFISRAQAIKADFKVTNANAPAVVEICARLDGLPLAIELAAARSKLLPPQALLARLGHRLEVLTSGARDAPARQQTLRNTVAWSYDLLTPEEQRLFRRLSAFVGGCTLEAAEAVCNAAADLGQDVVEGVTSLLDKSLVQQTVQDGKEPRLVLLETIREYGLECLAVSGEMEGTQQAHAEYYLTLAEEELEGFQQTVWLDRLQRELDNVRTALQWSLEQVETRKEEQSMELALRLGGALGWFWEIHGHWSEGRNFLERVLTLSEGAVGPTRAKVLQHAGILASYQNDSDRAQALLEESLVLFRQYRDAGNCAYTLRNLGQIALNRYNYAAARLLLEEALACAREVDDKLGIAIARHLLGWIAFFQGDYTGAQSMAEEGLVAFHKLDEQRGIAGSLELLGRTVFSSRGDHARASTLLEESLALYRKVGDVSAIADALVSLGQLVLHRGDVAMARVLAEESFGIYREIGSRLGPALSLALLAKVEAHQGDYVAAHARYEEGLVIAREVDDKLNIASGLEGVASLAVAQGEPAWAARLWGAAETLRETVGSPLPPVERAGYERLVAAARIQLDDKAFDAAWAKGRTMTPEQALAAQGPVTLPQQLATGPVPAPPAKAPSSPAGLTARELEVLRLLATGLTDAQIAEQLVLSLHTIHAHLRTIYSKLGVTSRSAATRYAFEHQLM